MFVTPISESGENILKELKWMQQNGVRIENRKKLIVTEPIQKIV